MPISALLQGAFNTVTTAMTNSANKKINKQNNDFNAEQAKIERDWQEYMYNQYSSPSAQVEQLKNAGLNPALAGDYGGQTFSGSTASASNPIPMESPDLSQVVPLVAQILDLKDKFKNSEADRELKGEQAETERKKQKNLDSDTNLKDIDGETRREFNNTRIREIEQGISESLNRIQNDNERVKNETEELKSIISKIEKDKEVSDAQITNFNANVRKLNTASALDVQQKYYYAAQITYLWALSNDLYSSKEVKDQEILRKKFENNYLQQNGTYPREDQIKQFSVGLSVLGNGGSISIPKEL